MNYLHDENQYFGGGNSKNEDDVKKRRKMQVNLFWFSLVFLVLVGVLVLPLMDALGVPRLTLGTFCLHHHVYLYFCCSIPVAMPCVQWFAL